MSRVDASRFDDGDRPFLTKQTPGVASGSNEVDTPTDDHRGVPPG
jgi:hypothetical protein